MSKYFKTLTQIAALARAADCSPEDTERLRSIASLCDDAIVESPTEAAARYARSHARPKGVPPHWARCEKILDGQRCTLLDGHLTEHDYGKKEVTT